MTRPVRSPSAPAGLVALLRDTGSGPAERTAQAHLGVDLRQASTWSPVLEHIKAPPRAHWKITYAEPVEVLL